MTKTILARQIFWEERVHTMRRLSVFALAMAVVGAAFAQAPRVTGGGSLAELAGSGSLVTVVVKERQAEDMNLRVVEFTDADVSVLTDNGERHTYLFKDIQEIRVQEGQESVREWRPAQGRGMLPAQQQVVARATQRANDLFSATTSDQFVKMNAAAMLALSGDAAQQDEANTYLTQLLTSNDLRLAVEAALRMYLIGRENEVDPALVTEGLTSGNRQIRATSAALAGFLKHREGEIELYKMLRDRRPDFSVPAIRALAMLGRTDIAPTLVQMLTERDVERANAAVYALKRIGGEEVAVELKQMLESSDGLTRFRVAEVLSEIGDAESRIVLRDELMEVPTLQVRAALVLAPKGDIKAMRILRERLLRRPDIVESELLQRAEMAAALIEGGDRTAVPILQDLLRTEFPSVQANVCRQVTRLGLRSLVTLVQPAIESEDRGVAVAACQAAISAAFPEYRDRVLQSLWM